MKKNRILKIGYSIVFYLLMHACVYPGKNNNSVKVVRYKFGGIFSKTYFPYSKTTDSIVESYHENPNVISERIEYKDGKRNGWSENFNTLGKLLYKSFYVNDLENGIAYSFYETGNLETILYYVSGKQIGPVKYFFENGELQAFNFKDMNGKNSYVIVYDSLSRSILKEEGIVLCNFNLMRSIDSNGKVYQNVAKLNQRVQIQFSPVQLPKKITKVSMGEVGQDEMKPLKLNNFIATFETVFKTEGIHHLVIEGKILEPNGNVYLSQTLNKDIFVTK